jgi:hypothetical protein
MVIGSLAISPISGPGEAHDEQLLGPGGPATVFLLDLPKELGQLVVRRLLRVVDVDSAVSAPWSAW